MRHADGMEGIKVCAPGPGKCPICATEHDPSAPHDRDSLYYQYRLYRDNNRFPSWENAMNHCSEKVRAAWRKKLARRGVDSKAEGVTGHV